MGAHPTRPLRPVLRPAATWPTRPPTRRFVHTANTVEKKNSPPWKKSKKSNTNTYRASIFHEEITDKENANNNQRILKIIQRSSITEFSVQDCTLFLNYIIRNKKSKHTHNEVKNICKVKLTSSLYKEAISKIISSVLTYEEKHFCFFFQKFVELRDINAIERMLIHMHTNQLFRSLTLYNLVDIFYNFAVLNFEREKSEEALNTVLDYLLSNVIRTNGYLRHLEKKLINHTSVQGEGGKPVYIRSFAKRGRHTERTFPSVRKDNGKKTTNLTVRNGDDQSTTQFDVNSLSNVMLYKLIYSLAKINRKREHVKELLVLLIPYIRFKLQNMDYVFSKDRPDVIVKVLWAYAFLQVRHINLFLDFSLSIQVSINELKLDQLKIVKNIFLNFLIFDELLLDTLEKRIDYMEQKCPGPLSQPRKKPFKKKKRRVALTDKIKLKLER
ncbi:conserved Plasmodium protein, unknown function [Plasmodium knowlesi strain H]|uniref:Uncharacterized protein n=3 Tax=Plasmodium knowlesi TaxID=5850 RepID=A0A5K1UIL7_PLAKH|nr:conserved protein, unknown function [Plasmodium knowlesi strain H]OTN66412.1 Uncharacterized protein PKNOH_S09515700 [Plasmodium knowlesi]CAA9986330.1 conserved protein, unknown function [Plasmodium knowlesi strain H]SBO25572.1 conserved Plasmodium protein, unknown function [Plasmodium knowlesi strain H]SBO28314.1 conserved Plasmodium protein, unknown function [Plasmodium knowlesi strain H]VVS75804.1 conserved protein, unknown function [Plasmodium knowlesi strain H]|eukprot:XP_002257735.1 hypothetical protein, conserved in Plasmodium species [Plasmodium knowlesi strain H]